jgi:hypothetical protein
MGKISAPRVIAPESCPPQIKFAWQFRQPGMDSVFRFIVNSLLVFES